MSRSLRLPGESDDGFRHRAQRAGRIARLLVDASLANDCTQQYIADPALTCFTEASVRRSPIVRVEYDQAIAMGDIGSCLTATRSKHWGAGPQILPLEAADWYFPDRVTYQYRESSVYNRRFEQRRRLKELLGKRWRRLVGEAKFHTKTVFLQNLTDREARAVRDCIGVTAGEFSKAPECTSTIMSRLLW